jgi:hypothetical protein
MKNDKYFNKKDPTDRQLLKAIKKKKLKVKVVELE